MKKSIAVLLTLVMAFTICACGQQAAPAEVAVNNAAAAPVGEVGPEMVEFGQDSATVNESATITEKPAGIQPGTEFAYWTNADIPQYCPWIDARSWTVSWQCFDNLVTAYHGDIYDIRPCLAESWDISDDYCTYTFHLRQDAYFSNGEQVTAQAFVNTWDQTKSYSGRYFSFVDSYVALDDFTLEVTLTTATPTFLNSTCRYGSCAPVSIEAMNAYGPEDNRTAVGCGPYYVETYTPGEGFVLKASENYYNELKQPSIERIKVVVLPDDNTAILAFENGGIDCINFVSAVTYEVLENYGTNIIRVPDRVNEYWINPKANPIFKDAVVREAICHMINWNDVNELAYNGLYGVPDSYIDGPGSYPYGDNYTYDPQLGLKMLEDAGYKPEDIKFTLLADPDFAVEETVITQMFNDLGLVNVDFQVLDGATCYGMLRGGTYEIFPCHNGYNVLTPLGPYTMGLVDTGRPDLGIQPAVFIKDMNEEAFNEVMEYYDKALAAITFDEYVENVSQITRIVQENNCALGGLIQGRFYAVNPRISGVYPSQEGGNIEFCYLYVNNVD